MRTILFLLQKEFRQIFRNRSILPIIFVMPLMQLIVLPLAADYEVKNINLAVVDHDHSPYSAQLCAKISGSGYFRLVNYGSDFKTAFELIETDKADLVLEIPAGFERTVVRENEDKVFIAVNAINGVKAGLGGSYLNRILNDFNQDIRLKWMQLPRYNPMPVVEVTSSVWFNPHMNYNFFMVPGILAILVTMMGSYMTALNIVKEKEIGTIEQLNVTPIRKHHFVLGKLIPFWVLGMFVFSVGLFIIARLIYGIVPLGGIALLYGFLAVYLLAILGLGLLISTYCDTQQQAMSVTFFFMMIFMLMSGLFTSIDSMPIWAKGIAYLSPVTYFIEVVRMIVLKGSTFTDLKIHFAAIASFAVVLNTWAILNYKKRS
ncbi:MAG: ABC transporter permease [Bacteroidia bacterium]|nr:ABC transporter permease [Bacteroidia bacterium]